MPLLMPFVPYLVPLGHLNGQQWKSFNMSTICVLSTRRMSIATDQIRLQVHMQLKCRKYDVALPLQVFSHANAFCNRR